MSRPKTDWPGIFYLVRWYVLLTVKTSVARMNIHVSASVTYVYCILYARKIFPSTGCILSIVAFTYRFPGKSGLVLIPYSCSIKILLNL